MDDALNLDGSTLSPRFVLSVVTIAPGASRPYDAAEWQDAMVLVESGELALECTRGGRRVFGAGDLLPLAWLSLRALHNVGLEPVRLTAIARSSPDTDEFVPGSSSEAHDCSRTQHDDDAGGC
jgi:hypothetical protein